MKSLYKHLARHLVAGLFAVSISFGQGTTITLLHVNDTHSHLDAVGPKNADLDGTLGGIAKAATVIGTLRATESNVLLLHAGDVFQGDPLFNKYLGVPEFQLMTQLGIDAMAVGNHEFDFGPGVLSDVLSTAFVGGSFPLVSANLDMSAFPALQTWIQPSIMKTISGVKIGIFGMTVPNNPTNMPAPVVVRDDLVLVAQNAVKALRSQGADVIICLSHLGIYFDKIVVAGVSGLNFVIGGHDHYLFSQPVFVNDPDGKRVAIFQAGEHYKYVGKLHFTVENGNVTMNDYSIVDVDASVPPEPTIQGVVEFLKSGVIEQFGDLYHTVIGTARNDVTKRFDLKSPLRDTPMGNLVTDAFRSKTRTDIAITALGLISEKIYKGKIVGADVFRSMSYGFDETTGLGLQLATFDISGAELVKGLEIGLSQLEIGDDFFLQVSGMRFTYDPKQPVGQRVIVKSIHIDKKKFSPDRSYSVTVNTGILALLGSLGISVSNIDVMTDFEFHVVRDYIASRERINEHPEGRIRAIMDDDCDREKSIHDIGREASKVCNLLGNYPNPFNPATEIRFQLSEESYITLKIYNVIGQEVAVLVDGMRSAGVHEATWNASALPSGIYYARISSSGHSVSKRILLIK